MKKKLSKILKQTTHSEKETIQCAKSFAKTLKPGSVISLRGNLGSGKTTFIKGIALGLGLKNPDDVKSPTFALMHTYASSVPLYHFDLYRLESQSEVANIGFEEFVNDPSAVTCVEWGERAGDLLPAVHFEISLDSLGPNDREILITMSA